MRWPKSPLISWRRIYQKADTSTTIKKTLFNTAVIGSNLFFEFKLPDGIYDFFPLANILCQ